MESLPLTLPIAALFHIGGNASISRSSSVRWITAGRGGSSMLSNLFLLLFTGQQPSFIVHYSGVVLVVGISTNLVIYGNLSFVCKVL